MGILIQQDLHKNLMECVSKLFIQGKHFTTPGQKDDKRYFMETGFLAITGVWSGRGQVTALDPQQQDTCDS